MREMAPDELRFFPSNCPPSVQCRIDEDPTRFPDPRVLQKKKERVGARGAAAS